MQILRRPELEHGWTKFAVKCLLSLEHRERVDLSARLQSERPPFANLGPSSVVFTIQLHGPDHLFRIRWLIADKLEWPSAVFQTPALGLIQSLDELLFAPPKYQEWVLIPGSSSFNG
jgi:hypothetical protein